MPVTGSVSTNGKAGQDDDASGSRKMAEVVAQRIREKIAPGELVAGLITVKMGKGGGPRVSVPRIDSVAKQAGVLLQVRARP